MPRLSSKSTAAGPTSSESGLLPAAVWQINLGKGRFLPADDSQAARSFVVLGSKVDKELFRDRSSLGKIVRIAGERYRVIGVMESKGQMLGFDLDDAVYIPTARAMSLFNQQSLMEIDLLYQPACNRRLSRNGPASC